MPDTPVNYSELLEHCRLWVDEGDWGLAVFALRDTKLAAECNLTDLLWALHNGGAAKSEVEDILTQLEHYLAHR